jgi:hypothetical protein
LFARYGGAPKKHPATSTPCCKSWPNSSNKESSDAFHPLSRAQGRVGTSFVAAHLAMALAEAGHDVTAIDFTRQDSLKLYFGLPPIQPLPDLEAQSEETLKVAASGCVRATACPMRGFCRRLANGELPFRTTAMSSPMSPSAMSPCAIC